MAANSIACVQYVLGLCRQSVYKLVCLLCATQKKAKSCDLALNWVPATAAVARGPEETTLHASTTHSVASGLTP